MEDSSVLRGALASSRLASPRRTEQSETEQWSARRVWRHATLTVNGNGVGARTRRATQWDSRVAARRHTAASGAERSKTVCRDETQSSRGESPVRVVPHTLTHQLVSHPNFLSEHCNTTPLTSSPQRSAQSTTEEGKKEKAPATLFRSIYESVVGRRCRLARCPPSCH